MRGDDMQKNTAKSLTFLLAMFLCLFHSAVQAQSRYSTAPDGATVLFDGTDFSLWTNCDGGEIGWKIMDGVMEVVPAAVRECENIQGIKTKDSYRDFQLHLEFRLMEPEANSGVYIQRRYEVQIADSYGKPFGQYMGGSIYRQKLPDMNVGKAPGEWQSYDIIFRAPRFENDGFIQRKIEDARITVVQNGIVIHNNVIIQDKTGRGFPEGPEPGPIMLQDHESRVQFRNIWIFPSEQRVFEK